MPSSLKRKFQTETNCTSTEDADDHSDGDFALSLLNTKMKKPKWSKIPSALVAAASSTKTENPPAVQRSGNIDPLTHCDTINSDNLFTTWNVDHDGDVLSLVHNPNNFIRSHDEETMDTIDAKDLDDQITEAEFEELSTLTWKRLKTAVLEEYRDPGGVTW